MKYILCTAVVIVLKHNFNTNLFFYIFFSNNLKSFLLHENQYSLMPQSFIKSYVHCIVKMPWKFMIFTDNEVTSLQFWREMINLQLEYLIIIFNNILETLEKSNKFNHMHINIFSYMTNHYLEILTSFVVLKPQACQSQTLVPR